MTPELIKILFLATDTTNEARLHLGEEAREIRAKLQFARERDRFAYEERFLTCVPDISKTIQDEKPGVVHFVGYGVGKGGLRFENPGSETHLIPTVALSVLFEKYTDTVKCVVLNGCYVEEQAKVIAQHIDYVVGVKDTLSDEAATAFVVGFYEALAAGRTVKQALARGKVQLYEYNLLESEMPTLFIRDGVTGDIPVFGPPSEDGKPDRGVNLPARNEFFTGREESLEALHSVLKEHRRAAISQAIPGIGGIGKTALAVEFAYRYADDYEVRLFCRADSITSLKSGYKILAERLGLTKPGDDFETIVRMVKSWLGAATASAGEIPYLLILDNADFTSQFTPEHLKAFLPDNMAGHLLFTTRAAALPDSLNIKANPLLSLNVLQAGEAVQFMAERVRGEGAKLAGAEGAAAAELAADLSFFPLALEQAAAYIAQPGRNFRTYLPLFRQHWAEQVEKAKPDASNERKAVATTWGISFQEVLKDNPAAELLTLAAFLAPDAIPARVVFSAAAGPIPSLETFFAGREELEDREEGYYTLLGTLTRYSLVTIDVAAYAFSVHRLVQAVQGETMSPEQRAEWVTKAVATLGIAFPSGETETWAVCERLVTHVQTLVEHAQMAEVWDEATGILFNRAAYYLYQRGRYEEAEPLYLASLHVYRKAFPPGHTSIAGILDNLAALYKAQSRFDEAEPLLAEALHIRRDNLLVGHPDIAQSLNNLALLYEAQGRHDEAEALLVEALQIVRNSLPEGHPDIIQSLNNLAGLYMYQERYKEAETLYLQVMEIRRAALPKDHPDIARSLNNLAGVYKYQNRYREAEQLYREALHIFQNSLGDTHQNTKVVAQNLQIVLDEKKDYDKPRDLFGAIKNLFAGKR